jgi:hypothetical protein
VLVLVCKLAIEGNFAVLTPFSSVESLKSQKTSLMYLLSSLFQQAFKKLLDSQRRYLVRFAVEQKFKGVPGKEITLSNYQSDSPCSAMGFSSGETYLIYAYRSDDSSMENGGLCSRTMKLDERSQEYKDVKSFWFRFWSRLPRLS